MKKKEMTASEFKLRRHKLGLAIFNLIDKEFDDLTVADIVSQLEGVKFRMLMRVEKRTMKDKGFI